MWLGRLLPSLREQLADYFIPRIHWFVILGRRLAKRGDAFEAEMFGYNWAIDKDSLLTFVQKQKRGGGQHGPRGSQG